MDTLQPLIILPTFHTFLHNFIELIYEMLLEILEELVAIFDLHQFAEKLHDFSPPQTSQKQISIVGGSFVKFDYLSGTLIVEGTQNARQVAHGGILTLWIFKHVMQILQQYKFFRILLIRVLILALFVFCALECLIFGHNSIICIIFELRARRLMKS